MAVVVRAHPVRVGPPSPPPLPRRPKIWHRRAWQGPVGPTLLAVLTVLALLGPVPAAPAGEPFGPGMAAAVPPGAEELLAEVGPATELAPGVTHRGFRTGAAAGQVLGDVIEVDLTVPGVRMDALSPGVVAGRAPVTRMADATGAVAAVNGDFFDIGRTSAPVGPMVRGGQVWKAAVPQGRRAAPAVPGAEMDYVWSFGLDGVARIDRLPLSGEVSGPTGTTPIVALNQHAVPVGGVGVFTARWGSVDRSQTLCGTDTDRAAPCAADRWALVVRDGVVTAAGPPGAGPIPDGTVVLVGREQGAAALRRFAVGDPADVSYELVPASGVAPVAAVGAQPIRRGGVATERLDDRVRAPRSAAGHTADGRRVWLVSVDGRQSDSIGATLAELSALMGVTGAVDAVNLDGGGSSTLAFRPDGAAGVTIVNDPSDPSPRLVGNGLGVYSG